MSKIVGIKLRWLSPIPLPLGGTKLTCPARFEHQRNEWTENSWSLKIETIGNADDSGLQNGVARFLMDNAPNEWLFVGQKFTLYQGYLAIADGLIESIIKE